LEYDKTRRNLIWTPLYSLNYRQKFARHRHGCRGECEYAEKGQKTLRQPNPPGELAPTQSSKIPTSHKDCAIIRPPCELLGVRVLESQVRYKLGSVGDAIVPLVKAIVPLADISDCVLGNARLAIAYVKTSPSTSKC